MKDEKDAKIERLQRLVCYMESGYVLPPDLAQEQDEAFNLFHYPSLPEDFPKMSESMYDALLAGGEPIEAVQFFADEPGSFEEDDERWIPRGMRNKPLSWQEAAPLLQRQPADGGFGTLSAHEFYAWTATRIYYIHEYDGSHSLYFVPRNPQVLNG